MINFILNQQEIKTDLPPGLAILDFIRYTKNLTGTKIGCREGDCGACTILAGELINDTVVYRTATSCLMPIGNAAGKHVVTIEGLNLNNLTVVQDAFTREGATQCGFCTPGFVVSLTGFCMSDSEPVYSKAIDAMNGNICRCTGYKSIQRAAIIINDHMQQRGNTPSIPFAVESKIIPSYFLKIRERLKAINNLNISTFPETIPKRLVGGGTDLYVQQHDTIVSENINFLLDKRLLKTIIQRGNMCELGPSVTVSDIGESPVFQQHFPGLPQYIKLISSTPIRNMATIAGNFINASPIGDLTIFFLALDASVSLSDGNSSRMIMLKDLYKGYKLLDKMPEEYIQKIQFTLPGKEDMFNFEKVCKRTYLDIASVNTAIYLKMKDNEIVHASLSAGGIGPVPLFLRKSSEFLINKQISAQLFADLAALAQTEIAPISDARGTEAYKRLLLSQLIKAHFIKLFPALPLEQLVFA